LDTKSKFQKGEIVNFLYIHSDGSPELIKNARIDNIQIWNGHVEYYFLNQHRNIQYVWVPEHNVHKPNEHITEVLYG